MKINEITQEQFEDIHFNPDLVVVEKTKSLGKEYHITSLFVYENKNDKMPKKVFTREITSEGTTYCECEV
ncbi:cytochrome C biogenesis protein CcmE [Klebsiella pneumoniae]|uniref:cytochrome C biogenesis protein CcmE n=1 Tax=Klebsiella pneumoniae TaxID=573 RepID=UPI00272F6C62|nr:cytochrome C biogenesis protein CcmE [Klebsiella pneumoniae]MDP1183279.1 cytochrome C biogenesis protein CcmE [Klebsiella pneumoniae]